jgi:CheY-like chemotaxis protein
MMFASPARQQVEAARCQELGIAGHVAKPIRQAALFRALQEAWGLAAAVPVGPPAAAAEPGAAARPRRVLLAEDNPVSQKIVVAMLEKVGHAVVVANNGKEVLAALATPGGEAFDLILMDVQMPEMDGVTATQRIREEERAAGGHIPIVALTASAMKSDMELCLAAGMDDYLTKPLQRQDLLAAIARWPAGP